MSRECRIPPAVRRRGGQTALCRRLYLYRCGACGAGYERAGTRSRSCPNCRSTRTRRTAGIEFFVWVGDGQAARAARRASELIDAFARLTTAEQ